jgi:hypothetical protein
MVYPMPPHDDRYDDRFAQEPFEWQPMQRWQLWLLAGIAVLLVLWALIG